MLDKLKSDNNYYIVLNYCNGGNLSTYINLVKRVPEEVGRLMIKQVVEGMHHMYKLNVIHRDLKLANLFLHFPDFEGKEHLITDEWLKSVDLLQCRF